MLIAEVKMSLSPLALVRNLMSYMYSVSFRILEGNNLPQIVQMKKQYREEARLKQG